jgi:hypothetical protein
VSAWSYLVRPGDAYGELAGSWFATIRHAYGLVTDWRFFLPAVSDTPSARRSHRRVRHGLISANVWPR